MYIKVKKTVAVKIVIHEFQVPRVHDDPEERFARGVFELSLDQVDGHDLLVLELADDALSPAPDVQDQPRAGKSSTTTSRVGKV